MRTGEVLCVRVEAWAFPGELSRKAVVAVAGAEFPEQRVLKVAPFGLGWLVVLSPAPLPSREPSAPIQNQSGDPPDTIGGRDEAAPSLARFEAENWDPD